jgi:hypothetical protein
MNNIPPSEKKENNKQFSLPKSSIENVALLKSGTPIPSSAN